MDYYKCEKCKKVFNEYDMNFKFAQEYKKTLCENCIKGEEMYRPNFSKDVLMSYIEDIDIEIKEIEKRPIEKEFYKHINNIFDIISNLKYYIKEG